LGNSLKQRFAADLWLLADLVRADATRREFRSRAYRRAVWSLDELSSDLGEPYEELLNVPGIGPGVARLISEFREQGAIAEVGRLLEKLPREANRLRLLPRMTPARLRWLKAGIGVDTVQDLVEAIRQERLAELRGVGPDTSRVWLERLPELLTEGLTPIAARQWAFRLVSHIERHVPGAEVVVTGSVRRLEEWVSKIDLVVAEGEGVGRFMEQSAVVTESRGLNGGMRFETLGAALDMHMAGSQSAAAVMFRTTGPGEHVEAIVASIGDGASIDLARTETDIYRSAGLGYVPPPARTRDLDVPSGLIGLEHLKGDLHLHSDWSPDGRQTIEELVVAARSRGLQYVAITDHAKGLRFGGLDEERIGRQRETIERIRLHYPDMVILQGSELNIDRDGQVDFDEELLDRLDIAIAAVHSHFTLDQKDQTRRVLNAIANPKVNVIAHLTGRRIGIRPPIELDAGLVLAAAVEFRTALEVNGHLDRMDISARLVQQAVGMGALFAANSDAHRPDELSNAGHSVGILQRGLVTQPDVVNTWPVADLLTWSRGR
jgi:DNA polymerase (family 10)